VVLCRWTDDVTKIDAEWREGDGRTSTRGREIGRHTVRPTRQRGRTRPVHVGDASGRLRTHDVKMQHVKLQDLDLYDGQIRA